MDQFPSHCHPAASQTLPLAPVSCRFPGPHPSMMKQNHPVGPGSSILTQSLGWIPLPPEWEAIVLPRSRLLLADGVKQVTAGWRQGLSLLSPAREPRNGSGKVRGVQNSSVASATGTAPKKGMVAVTTHLPLGQGPKSQLCGFVACQARISAHSTLSE
jgi:hypothetical protein